MKFTREVPREFADYNYDEILLENIKQACTQHFKEKRNCDILASEQGPSCTRLDQLPNLNLIFIRFTTLPSIKNNGSASESWTLPSPMKKAKSFENKAIEKKSFIPKSLSVINIMKLGKIIRNKERSSAKVLIEKLNVENSEWSISKEAIFEIEDKAFAEDGFRMAYKANSDDESLRGNTWVVKKYNASSKETFQKMGETCESQSRKRLHYCHSCFPSFVDSYIIRQCFGFIKVLKIPTRRINWVLVRYPISNKHYFSYTTNGNMLF